MYYLSHNKLRKSILGSSWTLSENYIVRDINYTYANISDDMFRLVFNSQTYDLVYNFSQNRFYTKVESYLYIENKTSANNTKGQYFTVKTKDGTQYRFGYNNESELVSNQTNYTIKWSLDLINDTNSNQIYYSYKEDPFPDDISAVYLANIQYNNDRNRSIEFLYEPSNRPDLWFVYDQGTKIQESRRLKEILVYANNNLVNRYIINYTSNNLSVKTTIGNITAYGSDNLSSLPSTTFNYVKNTEGWHRESIWWMNINATPADKVIFSSKFFGIYDYGIRFGDVNGDGLVDVMQSYQDANGNTNFQTYVNNGSGWVNGTTWRPPTLFLSKQGIPQGHEIPDFGIRFGDVNGDGFVDIIRGFQYGNGTQVLKTYINNKSDGWLDNNTWQPPIVFAFYTDTLTPDYGVRLEDVNGDGLVDIIQAWQNASGNNFATFINNGSGGWNKSATWISPVIFGSESATKEGIYDYGIRLEDVNGDGLVDILVGFAYFNGTTIYKSYINNGTGGWQESSLWKLPVVFAIELSGSVSDNGVRFGDVNGDGLIDIMQSVQNNSGVYNDVFINNGSGWVNTQIWDIPVTFYYDVGGVVVPDFGIRFGDVNGDGLMDIVKSYEIGQSDADRMFEVYINNISNSYLLSNVTNSYGGRVDVGYQKSTAFNNTGNDSISDLGFNLWVVSNLSQDNGVNGSGSVLDNTNYFYQGGFYNFKDKEFRGFNFVIENKSNLTIKHYFHQDTARSGLELKKETYDYLDNLYGTTQYTWDNMSNSGYYINKLLSVATYTYDGFVTSPKINNITYGYDIFGNILSINNSGDIDKAGDEKYEFYEYLNNSNLWIVDKPKHYLLFDINKTNLTLLKLRESFFSYDNLNYSSAPLKGKLSYKEDYLNTGGSNPITNYSYDSFGNLIELKDPNNNSVKYIYGIRDNTFTFVNQVKNAKNQTTDYSYDLGTGNLLSETDSNRFVKNYTYDVFGRKTNEILPYDSVSYPTKEYQYEINGTAPIKIKTLQREINGTNKTFDTFVFYDGFGRVIQQKSEADNNKQIVVDTFYDQNSRLISFSNPYFTVFSENYTLPNQSIKRTNYTYDPLNRIILINNPDNSKKILKYNQSITSFYDENNHQKDYYLDPYNRINNVIEFSKGENYNTTYKFDASDNLIEISDSQNNTFTYFYDTLGRKIKLRDPDLGVLNYTYDKVGNLIKQVDNKNISISIVYDQINRIISKNSSTANITYTYDLILNGTLSKSQTSNLSVNYTYDNRLRRISEIKTIDNKSFTSNWTYDSMDRITLKILPDGKNITYTYNNQSKLNTISDIINDIGYNEASKVTNRSYSNLLVTNYTYNATNFRLTRIKTNTLQDLNYYYDPVGNINQINDTATQEIYFMTYDNLDRLTYAQKYNLTNQVYTFRENYTYNSIGNMLSMTSDIENLTYSYNQNLAHAPIRIQSKSRNDPSRFIVKNSSSVNVAWFGNKGNIILKGNCTANLTCSAPANSFTLKNNTGGIVGYIDNKGNMCIKTGDCSDRSISCDSQANSFIIKDSNNAIVSYINSIGDLCLTGNLVQNSNDVDSPVYNYTLTYDANGNLIQGFGKYYEYDGFNQLSKVRQGNSTGTLLEEYLYDHEGKRIKKVEYSTNTTTYYIDENFIQIVNSSGVYNETYYYAEDTLVAKKDNNGVLTFYHPDHLGSSSLTTNSSGGKVETTSYNPYGEIIEGGNSRYTYNGKEKDDSNLYYYGARYYKADTFKHFIQPDISIVKIYDPQGLNRYAYVLNNPYKYIDPSGKYSCDAQAGCDLLFSIGQIHFIAGTPTYSDSDEFVEYFGITFVKSYNTEYKNQGFNQLMSILGFAAVGGADTLASRGTSGIAKTSENFKSFTKGNFRENVGILSGRQLSKTEEAHHVFPQAPNLAKEFQSRGININDPRYSAIVDKETHRSFSYQYNKDWETFFAQNKNPSTQQILEKGKELSEQYKFKINYKVTKKI